VEKNLRISLNQAIFTQRRKSALDLYLRRDAKIVLVCLEISHGEKEKNLKDFGRPHRGQILVTDTLVTVLPTLSGGRTHLCRSVH